MKYLVKRDKIRKNSYIYGANAEKLQFLKNIIIVPLDKNDLFLVYDNNCNIIGIEKYDINSGLSVKDYFEGKYNNYLEEENMIPDLMSDSFDNYSLGLIQKIDDRCSFDDSGNGHLTNCYFDDKIVDDQYLQELLSYFKFLGRELYYYSQANCSLQKMGYDVPSFSDYISSVNDELDSYLNECIKDNERPFSDKFMSRLGHRYIDINPAVLDSVFTYLLREKGYSIDYLNKKIVENEYDNDIDVSDVSVKLLELMK